MLHTLQGLMSTLLNGFTGHLEQWVGWAALVAATLFGVTGASPWMPLLVAMVINPTPYSLVAGLLHGRSIGLNGLLVFTAIQLCIAYAGLGAGRMLTRFRR